MADRGVLYIIWGDKIEKSLQRSINSLKKFHPELPVHVERISSVTSPVLGLAEKARMADITPFEETLYLDADTVIMGRLDFGFRKAADFGLACCISECPWARRYNNSGMNGDEIEYNTGVLFFTKKAGFIFETWKENIDRVDSSVKFINPQDNQIQTMIFNDQASFARSIEDNKFSPYVLPLNWNYRPIWQNSFFGPIKVWHDYSEVPEELFNSAQYYENPQSIIQFFSLNPGSED